MPAGVRVWKIAVPWFTWIAVSVVPNIPAARTACVESGKAGVTVGDAPGVNKTPTTFFDVANVMTSLRVGVIVPVIAIALTVAPDSECAGLAKVVSPPTKSARTEAFEPCV